VPLVRIFSEPSQNLDRMAKGSGAGLERRPAIGVSEMMWGVSMAWSGWFFMILTTVAFWALVVFGMVALFRGADRPKPHTPMARERAREILDERFARGEIEADEYRARNELLPGRDDR